MTITAQYYKYGKLHLGDGTINLGTAPLKVIPLTVTYTFNQAHQFVSSLTNEVTTLGGVRLTLASQSWALSGNNARFDCEDLVWTASGGALTQRQWALADYTGAPADTAAELLLLLTSDVDLVAGDGTQIKVLTPSGLFDLT